MYIINLNLANELELLPLGVQGEDQTRCIAYDMTDLITEFGEGTFQYVYKHDTAYPQGYPLATTSRVGNVAKGVITKTETTNANYGSLQFIFYPTASTGTIPDNFRTKTYRTYIFPSVAGTETADTPTEAWISRLMDIEDGYFEAMTASASTLAAGSSATVTKTKSGNVVNLAFGIPKGDKGDTGDEGEKGDTGEAAGFGTPTATATTLTPGSSATATVTASGEDTAKVFSFSFGIPKGDKGDPGDTTWGSITGTLSNQTDLQTALNAKSTVSVASTGTSTDEVEYITIDGTEKKIKTGDEAAWGNISGTLSNQTDLQAALDDKEDAISGGKLLLPTASWVSPPGEASVTTYTENLSNVTVDSDTFKETFNTPGAHVFEYTYDDWFTILWAYNNRSQYFRSLDGFGITYSGTPVADTDSITITVASDPAGPHHQNITISGTTSDTRVDLQPDSDTIQQLIDDGTSGLYVANDNNTLTVYAVGDKPTADIYCQFTLTDIDSMYSWEKWSISGSSKGSTYYGVVTSDSSSTYPMDGASGGYWYSTLDFAAKPTNTSITANYTGSVITNGYTTPHCVTMTGNNSGTAIGTYTATYTPKAGYAWTDGTTSSVTVTLIIEVQSL